MSTRGKWHQISNLMRNNKIDILAVQETHLSQQALEEIQDLFEKQLYIFASANPTTTNAAGAAIIMNKATTRWKEVDNTVLVPGRAISTTIPWGEDKKITCTSVYAPNNPNENKTFWEKITKKQTRGRENNPTILLGDFNIVEDAADRLPPHPDSATATASLADYKNKFNLMDGWRGENPNKIAFTFRTDGGDIQSRLDRIYVKNTTFPYTLNWGIQQTGIKTDHKLVVMDILNPWAPHMGKGRYAMPVRVLEEESLLVKLEEIGLSHLKKIEALQANRTTDSNPQKEHKKFKTKLVETIRLFSKKKTSDLQNRIDKINDDLEDTLNKPSPLNEEQKRHHAALLDEKIRELETIKLTRNRDNNAARYALEGETISKYWINLNKTRNPRDVMIALRNPVDNNLERRSDKMAEIAKNYHENLQNKDLPPNTEETRLKIEETLTSIDKKIPHEATEKLCAVTSYEEIEAAISKLPPGKAAGLDGIPLEVWKTLKDRHSASKDRDNSFDVIRALEITFSDIENFGVEKDTAFAEGWMCPIYKKGDKADIGNYRPITVLNTDYKIYTKILSKKIEEVAPNIIHNDQAGFMKGRKITDQTELAAQMIEWCEQTETNGMIVCLDQEKAYDKITHDFLWAALEKNGFPTTFINRIKELYKDAYTIVIINGELSKPYLVIRGVRQGDPMSCLLFNIAIESLAQSLRKSELKGIRINNDERIRIITTLFADDTTVYLARKDCFHELQGLLDKWCQASGAKFNVPKSVIIPVGTEHYRKKLIRTRKSHKNAREIPEEIHIANEKEPTRILGAFVGNKIDNANIWSPTLERIQKSLTEWGRSKPTISGKRLIVNMIVGGLTQYKTAVQGMPTDVEKKIEKMIRNFIWADTRPTISMDTMNLPVEDGGIKLLDIKARNEAIELIKLKRYLKLDKERPTWALLADDLIEKNLSGLKRPIDEKSFSNTFLQTLTAKTRSGGKGLNPSIQRMIKTAKRHGVRFHPLLITPRLRKKMPAWHHLGTKQDERSRFNKTEAKCLRKVHKVRTVKDLLELAKMETDPTENHKRRKNCACNKCKEMRHKGCLNPRKCYAEASQQIKSLHPFWNPQVKQKGRKKPKGTRNTPPNTVTFNPDITLRKNMAEGFRVFCHEPTDPHINIEGRLRRTNNDANEKIKVYTDGSSKGNGTTEARAGAGIWFGHNDPRNKAIRIPASLEQTNNVGELVAILHAVENATDEADLHILTDSKIAMEAFTKNLESNEERGWLEIANKEIIQATVSALRKREGTTTFEKIKGHSGIEGNEEADRLANEGADKDTADDITITIDRSLLKPGTQLSKATQAALYKGIIRNKTPKIRLGTERTTKVIQDSIEQQTGTRPTKGKIWKSIQHKDLPKKIRALMWKSIHNAVRVGDYWNNIPGYEERAMCPTCYTTESLEHILCECEKGPQGTIWKLNDELWKTTKKKWTHPNLGTLLGSQLTYGHESTSQDKENETNLERLFRIVISESLYLIWVLRCEWKIGRDADPEKIHTALEISNRWKAAILKRAKIDFLTSDKGRYGVKARDRNVVINTWKHMTPTSYTGKPGWQVIKEVLAGIGIA